MRSSLSLFRVKRMIAFSFICIKLINYLFGYWQHFLNAIENEETDQLQIDVVEIDHVLRVSLFKCFEMNLEKLFS